MLKSLQSLRFIFALMIFFHHYSINGISFKAGGPCGVSFFLILSGFVMSLGYAKQVQQSAFKFRPFFIKRIIRVYPLHILCLTLSLMFITPSLEEHLRLIPNLLLLQSWIPKMQYYFSGNAASWCLSDMVFFYAAFPFLIKWHAKYSKSIVKFFLFALLIYISILISLPDKYTHRLLYIFPLFRLFDFIIGILLYHLYEKIRINCNKINTISYARKSLIEIGIIILTTWLIVYPSIPERVSFVSYYWPISILIILTFALFNKSGGIISSFLNKNFMVSLGEISFSFYMVHLIIIRLVRTYVPNRMDGLPWPISLFIVLATTLSFSYLLYHYFEKPIATYLKKRL